MNTFDLLFSVVFLKKNTFLQIFIVFNMFAFFSCFFRAQRGDLDFYKIFKNGFAPSIWHLNTKKNSKHTVLITFTSCVFTNLLKCVFIESSHHLRKFTLKHLKNQYFVYFYEN